MKKRMMKKIAALALSAVMALSLAACGGGGSRLPQGAGTARKRTPPAGSGREK